MYVCVICVVLCVHVCACTCIHMHTYVWQKPFYFPWIFSHPYKSEWAVLCWALTMFDEELWECQHLAGLSGGPFLWQLCDLAGFLLSSSLCSERTGSAGYVAEQVLTAGKSCPGPVTVGCLDFLGACAPQGWHQSWQLEEENGAGLGWASLAVARSAEWEGTVKATELSTSLPHVLPAGLGKVCQEKQPCGWSRSEGTCSPHIGPGVGRTLPSCSLSRSVLCLSLCPCPCLGESRECTDHMTTCPWPKGSHGTPTEGWHAQSWPCILHFETQLEQELSHFAFLSPGFKRNGLKNIECGRLFLSLGSTSFLANQVIKLNV